MMEINPINFGKKSDNTGPDEDADKSGSDVNSDPTKRDGENKFDKPKREVNPDRTDIDTESDKTKRENN